MVASRGAAPVAAGERKKRAVAAKVEVRLPALDHGLKGLTGNGGEVEIVEPREWDGFRGRFLGVV